MGSASRGLLGTLRSWFFSPYSDDDKDPRKKNYYQVYYDQPRPTSPLRATPHRRSPSKGRLHKDKRKAARQQQGGGDVGWMDRSFFSGKRKAIPPRRPQISTPFNFQHTGSGAVDFGRSTPDLPRSAPPFRRLELSIYEPDNQVSPLLPYFADDGDAPRAVSPPEPALTRDVFDDDDTTLAHSRSYSSLSFHIPRRPVGGDAASLLTVSNFGDSPPRIPPRARTRPRAYTSPSVEAIVERIASAIIERDLLQDEIESVKERRSVCLSRPSTSYGPPDEPLPEFPTVMPPTAPSFAERVSIDRPRTAPSTKTAFYPPPPPPPPKDANRVLQQQQAQGPARRSEPALPTPTPTKQQAVQASAFHSHPPCDSPRILDNSIDIDVPLAPPLPLILRPPLRKKKSFSRVSNWLFPAGVEQQQQQQRHEAGDDNDHRHQDSYSPTATRGAGRYHFHSQQRQQQQQHRRDVSSDSVTNAPRALTDKDGYYQTLPPSALFSGRRSSFDSMSDVDDALLSRAQTGSVYSTDEEMLYGYAGRTTATATATATTSTYWSSPANTPPEAARRQLGVGVGVGVLGPQQKQEDEEEEQQQQQGVVGLRGGETFGVDVSAPASAPMAMAMATGSPVEAGLRVPGQGQGPVQGPRPTSVGVAF